MSRKDEQPENRLRRELPEEVPASASSEGPAAVEEESAPTVTGRRRLVQGRRL